MRNCSQPQIIFPRRALVDIEVGPPSFSLRRMNPEDEREQSELRGLTHAFKLTISYRSPSFFGTVMRF